MLHILIVHNETIKKRNTSKKSLSKRKRETVGGTKFNVREALERLERARQDDPVIAAMVSRTKVAPQQPLRELGFDIKTGADTAPWTEGHGRVPRLPTRWTVHKSLLDILRNKSAGASSK